MILLIPGLAIVMVIIGALLWERREELPGCLISAGIAILIISAFVFPIVLMLNTEKIASLKAVYVANYQNYGIAVDKSVALLSAERFEASLIAGSIEKFQQAGFISERIKEWRDEINEFNKALSILRAYDTNIWTGVTVPDIPDDLKFLTLK